MDEFIINEWNRTVSDDDTVYILGDISFYSVKKTVEIVSQLKGKKILIVGNHDESLLKDNRFKRLFEEIHPYLKLKHKLATVIMMHYPIAEYDGQHKGNVHLHGHLHGKKIGLEKYRIRDVAFDSTGKVISSLDEIITDALTGEIKSHH